MKRICIDLDGVIAGFKKEGQSYSDCDVVEGAREKIQELKKNGNYIIIYTARHMKTCNGNTGKIIAKISKQTMQWLDDNHIEYDEIYFGKPWADIYIDDNAYRFESWAKIESNGSNLPESCENINKK